MKTKLLILLSVLVCSNVMSQTQLGTDINGSADASGSGDVGVIELTLASGLIAYYPFEGNANDESGLNHHGTVFGATLTSDKDGNPDSAYLFDGVDDYIDVGDWSNGGAMSFTFWVRWDAYHNYSRIIDLGNGASNENIVVSQRQSNDELFFSIYIGAGETRMWTSTITLSQWDFYTATVDDSGIMTLYRNGEQIAQKPDGVTPGELLRTQQFIGRSNFSQDGHFEGAIDELRIYDRALTEAEIRVLYGDVEETLFRDGFEAGDTE